MESYGNGTAVSATRHCTVNVTMTDGRVSALNYLGPTGGLLSPNEQCAYAVASCVHLARSARSGQAAHQGQGPAHRRQHRHATEASGRRAKPQTLGVPRSKFKIEG